MEQFLSRHKEHISGVLSGFDRLLFRGTLRSISYLEGMAKFLSYHHILLKDFGSFVEKQSCHLKEHTKAYAHHHRRPYLYLQSLQYLKRTDRQRYNATRQCNQRLNLCLILC